MGSWSRARLSGVLAVMMVLPGVAVAHHLGFVEAVWDNVGGVDGLGGAFATAVSPDGAHLYVAGYSENTLAVFTRDPADGRLGFVETHWDGIGGVDGLAGAYGVAISPDGATVYAVGSLDNALAAFARNPVTGSLTFVEVQRDGVGGVDYLAGASAVAVSPDGAHVMATSFWEHALNVFARDQVSGELTFVGVQRDGVGGVDGLANVTAVAVSPDGAHVYTAAEGDSAVAVFALDPASGALTFVEAQFDGVGGVQNLGFASSVAVSPDGSSVYAASRVDSAIVVFTRDPSTGALELVEEQCNGASGVYGMSGPRSVTVAPDGTHVYVAATTESSVVAFSRDPATSRLSFLEFRGNASPGIDGLAGAKSVEVDPSGETLCATGSADGTVVVFALMLFGDDFEWGVTSEWSVTVP